MSTFCLKMGTLTSTLIRSNSTLWPLGPTTWLWTPALFRLGVTRLFKAPSSAAPLVLPGLTRVTALLGHVSNDTLPRIGPLLTAPDISP